MKRNLCCFCSTHSSRNMRSIKFFSILTCVIIVFFTLFVFVGIPLMFQNNIEVQRALLFGNLNTKTARREFNNSRSRNIYVTVDEREKVSLGVLHILPDSFVGSVLEENDYDYDRLLANTSFDVIMYFHGTGVNHFNFFHVYNLLSVNFHVIAFDYRNFGDSTPADLSEEAVAKDAVELYKWIRNRTKTHIYIWGFSLGTALATNMVAKLKNENIVPMGLILEGSFTNMEEEIRVHPFGKLFTWLPWYKSTILDTLRKNKFLFQTDEYILKVDCPIMILHAEDDSIVPYTLGKKLANIAQTRRNMTIQGNVTYHQFPARLGYDHIRIGHSPKLIVLIKDFFNICEEFNSGKG